LNLLLLNLLSFQPAFMDKKRILAIGVVSLILAALVYVQFRYWHSFDWPTFWSQTGRVDKVRVLTAVVLIYFAYFLRAVRWKVFLKPVRPNVRALDLVSPTVVGFSGLALLGRAGEFIRPYLIARRTELPVSSQLAVWGVERLFDFGGFTLLILVWLFQPGAYASVPHQEYFHWFQRAVFLLAALVIAGAVGAAVSRRSGEATAAWVERRFAHLSSNFGRKAGEKIREFGEGMNTIHDLASLARLAGLSVGMWYVIALAYFEVTHAYGAAQLQIPLPQLLMVVLASMLGSILQLPGVGGGSQLATITVLSNAFGVPPEMAASCGILIWLVGFVAVIPAGLLLAHRERLSLRRVAAESQEAEGG
jgi:glycosyltransferase 2 family protein